MLRKTIAAMLVALALPAAAQGVVPAANYSDIWWNPVESGWGVTLTQHAPSTKLFAVWYTYDPRAADSASPGNFKPLWIVMPDSTWVTPTRVTGDVYVTVGTPFAQNWNTASILATRIGTFTFDFSSSSTGTFAYAIAAPAGLASTDPAFGMPSFAGTKQIQRQPF
jgi:hypothetical protein